MFLIPLLLFNNCKASTFDEIFSNSNVTKYQKWKKHLTPGSYFEWLPTPKNSFAHKTINHLYNAIEPIFPPKPKIVFDEPVFHSQVKQDFFVLSILDRKRNGIFVELAANDYKRISNSYTMETYFGWDGICIEPNPMYLKNLVELRRCLVITNPVAGKTNQIIKFRY
jgi:hypothetical protein